MSTSEHFSPFRYVFQFLSPSDDKALKHAFYNTVTLAFLALFALACVAVYFILEAFIRPLIWALLIGSCLHPLKSKLSSTLKYWLREVQLSHRPLFVEAAIFPFSSLVRVLDDVCSMVYRNLKYAIAAVIGIPSVYVLSALVPIKSFIAAVVTVWDALSKFLSYFSTAWILLAVILYLTLVAFYWSPDSQSLLKLLSLPVWTAVVFHLSSVTGIFGVPLFIFFTFLVFLGCAVEVRDSLTVGTASIKSMTRRMLSSGSAQANQQSTATISGDEDEEEEEENDSVCTEGEAGAAATAAATEAAATEAAAAATEATATEAAAASASAEAADSEKASKDAAAASASAAAPSTRVTAAGIGRSSSIHRKRHSSWHSRNFFLMLMWAHCLAYTWWHLWVISLLPLVAVLLLLRRIGGSIVNTDAVQQMWQECCDRVCRLVTDRLDVLLPLPVRGVWKLLRRGDQKLADILSQSIDTIVSIFVIALVLTASVFIGIFLVIQVQRESIELISISSSVLNSTVVTASNNFLPERDNLQKLLDSMLGNAYVFGREWLSKKINSIFDTSDYNKGKIEEQVLQLWDRLYEKLAARNFTWNAANAADAVQLQSLLSNATAEQQQPQQQPHNRRFDFRRQNSFLLTGSAWELVSAAMDTSKVLNFVRENLGVVTSVLESLWTIVRSNVNLLTTILTTVLSVVLGGGTAVLNFLLQSLVFLTSLYLLLRFSDEMYLPVQFVASLSSGKKQHPFINALYSAVNEAVSGVFLASMKMSCFYGLYTNLIHSIFAVNLVFVPSVLAAVFGAVPFLGIYWACVPGALELSFLHGQPAAAAAFAVLHLLPTYVVDSVFYGEIKGAGHPYLTGLSVAGGLYWCGLEGAIFGPILLACLLVAVNVYSFMLAPNAAAAMQRGSTSRHKRSAASATGACAGAGGGGAESPASIRRSVSLHDSKLNATVA